MEVAGKAFSTKAQPYTVSLRPVEVTQFERSIQATGWLEHLAKEERSEKVRRALATVQKLTNSDPEMVRRASLTAADNTLSELRKIRKELKPSPSKLITTLNILAHLQILGAALAELERGPRGGDIILVRAIDLLMVAHELDKIAEVDVGKLRESLRMVEASVKHVIELNKPQSD